VRPRWGSDSAMCGGRRRTRYFPQGQAVGAERRGPRPDAAARGLGGSRKDGRRTWGVEAAGWRIAAGSETVLSAVLVG
jgi:hypothetical protein